MLEDVQALRRQIEALATDIVLASVGDEWLLHLKTLKARAKLLAVTALMKAGLRRGTACELMDQARGRPLDDQIVTQMISEAMTRAMVEQLQPLRPRLQRLSKRRDWTVAEDAALRELAEESFPAAEIGERLNREPDSCRTRARRLGIDIQYARGFKRATPCAAPAPPPSAVSALDGEEEEFAPQPEPRGPRLKTRPVPVLGLVRGVDRSRWMPFRRASEAHCHWPVGGDGADMLVCGLPVAPPGCDATLFRIAPWYCHQHRDAAVTPLRSLPRWR